MMKQDISIVTPVYNDWNCFQSLVKNISNRLRNDFDIIHIVVVNDCSSEQPTEEIISPDNIKNNKIRFGNQCWAPKSHSYWFMPLV